MRENQIVVEQLSKMYRVPVRPEGLLASMKSLTHRIYDDVSAVEEVSFSIQEGEVVGLIGPNGAGKTTMLKMLCGLLYPTNGQAQVAGFIPWERKQQFLRQISMVFGNKSQMIWDIPAMDSFRVLAEIYSVPKKQYELTLEELIELLEMKELLTKPVRNLSLGERMKCELVAGLIHRPSIIFLDEPTLGLDVSMQLRLRRFLLDYHRQSGVTILLTSHYMADVMALCPRVILVHHGRLIYDGDLGLLAKKMAPFKLVSITVENGGRAMIRSDELPTGVDILDQSDNQLSLRVIRSITPAVITLLLNHLQVVDLTIQDPPIEAVIDQVYQGGV